jgi:thiamine-monophosphate kinase
MRAASGQSLALGPGAEFDRIRGVIDALGQRAAGLGDDCALLPSGEGFVALSTDLSVEGVHFRPDWLSLEEVGWRAAAAALSDLAAEGAEATGVLSAITLPATAGERELLQVMSGVGAAADFAGAKVIGGDLSSGPGWSLAITVVGRAQHPVTRAGARPGDGLWLTGALGGSRAALAAWRRGAVPSAESRRCFAHPEPRISAGRWLAGRGARAMIDLSDGLAGDAAHLAAASAVRLDIDLGLLALGPEVNEEAERLQQSAQEFAAQGGEDYELLVALPPHFRDTAEFVRDCGIRLREVGKVEPGNGVRLLLDGRPVGLKGYDHFG